jgi:TPR repeat protein
MVRAMRPRPWHALVLLAFASACSASRDLLEFDAPKQKGMSNSYSKAGHDDYQQRQKDCWDMPSAAACYEVGLNYELGLTDPKDLTKAQQYYDKACELEKQPEHCDAARRLREKNRGASP